MNSSILILFCSFLNGLRLDAEKIASLAKKENSNELNRSIDPSIHFPCGGIEFEYFRSFSGAIRLVGIDFQLYLFYIHISINGASRVIRSKIH